jgi:hypothetical protein
MMKKITFYGKVYDENFFRIKKNFYLNNKKNLNSITKINSNYKAQTKRKKCQNCEKKIEKIDFLSFGVGYIICKNCSHLNGKYENSKKFAYQLYSGGNSKRYSLNYAKDYNTRVQKIYRPKVKFLKKIIKK